MFDLPDCLWLKNYIIIQLTGVIIPPGRIRTVTQVRYVQETIAEIRCVTEGVMDII